MIDMEKLRAQMVEDQIADRGIEDPLVLAALLKVPRERFVADYLQFDSYNDTPLPIGAGQTISQPYIVALMIEALQLKGDEKVLEVGAGCGYAAAVLSECAKSVFAIERIEELAVSAVTNLAHAGYRNVRLRHADGTQGWPEQAPFDAILVSAGAPEEPKSLLQQLAVGGRMVIPIGWDSRAQELVRITRTGEDTFDREHLSEVRFVPLVGQEGWCHDNDNWYKRLVERISSPRSS